MTVIAELNVIPITAGSMAPGIAAAVAALDEFDVSYETTPMGTIIEAPDTATCFDAAHAAHEAVDEARVITTLKVDDKRERPGSAAEKVTSLERELGRPARRDRTTGEMTED